MRKYFSSYWIRSAFFTILQRFSLTLFGFINFVELIRGLSKQQMGVWALFLVITTIFEATKSNLLKNAHIRFVCNTNEVADKTGIASSSLILNTAINLLFIIFILLFAGTLSLWLHAGVELGNMLRWFIPGLLFMVFFSHFEAIQQSHLDFKGVFAGYFVRQLLFLGIIVTHRILKIPFSLPYLALYQSISIAVGTIVLYFYSRRYMYHRFNPSTKWIRKILGYGGFIFASGITSNIFANLDQIMTANFMTSSAFVADYNAASRINGLIDIPSYAASEVLFPKVSKASVEEGPNKVRYLYERMVAILLSFTTPAAVFIIIFPNFVISLIAGPQYAEAAPILQLYMITGLLRPMQNQAANLLNSIGKPGLCFVINAISLAGNLVINYLCLMHFGFYGAAIGTLITCLLGTTAWFFIMKKQIGFEVKSIFKYSVDTYKLLYSQVINIISKTRQVHA